MQNKLHFAVVGLGLPALIVVPLSNMLFGFAPGLIVSCTFAIFWGKFYAENWN